MITVDKKLTDHRQELVTQTVQTNTQLLSLIMNNIPQAVFWKDRNLFFLGCNRAFVKDAGLTSPEDIIGKTDFDMPWKDHAELYRADDLRVMESGEPKINYEEPHTTSDGSRTWVRTSKIPVYEKGQIVAVLGMYEDITEQKRAEELLQRSEANLGSSLRVANMGYWEFDIATQMFTFNDQYYSLHGTTAQEVGGYQMSVQRFAQEFVYPEDAPIVGQATQQAIETTDPNFHVQVEARILRMNGEVRWVTVWFRIEKDAQDRTIKLHGVNQDITERKQMEEKLLLRDRALASSLNAVMINALDGKTIYINDAFLKLFGYSYEEALQLTPLDIAPPSEDVEAGLSAIQSQGFFIGEKLAKHKDGSIFPISLSSSLITNAEGQPIATQATFIDITERKQAEEALRESQQLLQTVMDNIPQSIFWKDNNLTYLGCNQAFAEDAGLASSNDIVGKTDWEMPWKEQAELYRADDSLVMKNGVPKLNYEEPQTTPDGSKIWLRTSKVPLHDSDGRVSAVLGMYEDITERKRLEQQVQTAFERRGRQVQLSTQVSQSIASASSLEELYQRVVTEVKEQFGYYHAQLLRYDTTQEAIVLVTGYGEVAEKMLAAGHHLMMGTGLIGTAAETGETVLRSSLENDPDWRPHPLLPDTKGEIAVPIKLGANILGVLDVQSDVAGALGGDDQLLLEGLCGQIATAIEKTRLTQEMGERLAEINRLYQAMSHEGWQTYRETAGIPESFIFDQGGLRQVKDVTLAEELFTNIPLTVPGGEVIGTLAVANDPQQPISQDDESFLLQVSEQVALALESARLFEQTQAAFIESEEAQKLIRNVIDATDDWIFVKDQHHRYQLVNRGYAKALHISVEDFIGKNDLELGFPEELVKGNAEKGIRGFWADDRLVMETGMPQHFPDDPAMIDGKVRVFDTIKIPLRDASGNVWGVLAFARDLTERKQAEEALQTSRTQLSEALDIAKLAHWEYDVNRDRFIFNDHFYSIFHTTMEQVGSYEISSAQYAEQFVYPEDVPMVGQEIEKALNSTDRHYTTRLEHRIKYADGGVGYISVNVNIDRDEQGNIIRYYGANQDITERKKAEEAIAKRATELGTVAQVSTTASTVLDPDKLLQSVVDLTKAQFGLYHAHIYLANQSWNALMLAAGAGEIGHKLVAEEHAIPISLEQSLVARAARERKAIIVNDVDSEPGFLPNPLLPKTHAEMAVPMIVGNEVLGVFDVQSDSTAGFSDEDANIYITLAAQVGVALQNARLYKEQSATVTQLRELDKLKSSFLANMSHELRTPLNSILGFTDVIMEGLDGPLTDNMDNDLRLIQKNGQHLLHLINDVLDMAKIEAGRMNLQPETFKAYTLLEEVTSITSTLASEKNLALSIDEDSDQGIEIYADNTRLRQVMINLVNNAIKFTERGKILLSAKPLEGARVLITVKDTGIGIPPEKLEAIFQEFTQIDSSSTRKTGGTGLGLPISRRLVEMHGGRLWAESTGIEGEGSTFFVELPVEARITEVVEKQVK